LHHKVGVVPHSFGQYFAVELTLLLAEVLCIQYLSSGEPRIQCANLFLCPMTKSLQSKSSQGFDSLVELS
jgi:hypothetical protein